MKAVVIHAFGGNEVVDVRDMPMPSVEPDDVLIRVRAAGVNPVDWSVLDGVDKPVIIDNSYPRYAAA